MKVYFEAVLKVLAMCSGHRAETLKSIGSATNFKCTDVFLMQVWEAMFGFIFSQYLSSIGAEASSDCKAVF